MLDELAQAGQPESETATNIDLSFAVTTRDSDTEDIVERVYTFAYAKEWDKWMFHEYVERRSQDTERMSDRNWQQTEHIFWNDMDDTREIDIPSTVTQKLADATGAESVTLQSPANTT